MMATAACAAACLTFAESTPMHRSAIGSNLSCTIAAYKKGKVATLITAVGYLMLGTKALQG